jgi:hypothetical protein
MVKRLKSTKKVLMCVKKLFEHLPKRKKRYIKAKLTMLICSSFTPKRVVLVSLLSRDVD